MVKPDTMIMPSNVEEDPGRTLYKIHKLAKKVMISLYLKLSWFMFHVKTAAYVHHFK